MPELAQLSCMSVPSFCKKFKEQTGMTVIQYINEKRVACAASLLKQSQYSLDEIAALAGFSNSNYLLRVFNKCSKNSPTSSGGEMNCTAEHICSKKSL